MVLLVILKLFTDCVIQSLIHSEAVAKQLGESSITECHLLLGLLNTQIGIAAGVLLEFKMTPKKVHALICKNKQPAKTSDNPLPFSPNMCELIAIAWQEKTKQNQFLLNTGHLLLALTELPNSEAMYVLQRFGAEEKMLQEKIFLALQENSLVNREMCTNALAESKLSGEMIVVLMLAEQEARRTGHWYIGTEHILVGLVGQGDSFKTELTSQSSSSIDRVRDEVVRIIGLGSGWNSTMHLTPRALQILQMAADKALSDGRNEIKPRDALYAILQSGKGVAARVILNLDLQRFGDPKKEQD